MMDALLWNDPFIIYNRGRVLHGVKNLVSAIEDSGRLFNKVDTAAPGKAMPVMRISRFHPCSSKQAPSSTRECVT